MSAGGDEKDERGTRYVPASFHYEKSASKKAVDYSVGAFTSLFTTPAEWLRSVMTANTQEYPWYHRRFRRVPDIDQCYVGDDVCIEEANMQYLRDMQVDTAIKDLLRKRFDDCLLYEYPNHDHINDKDSPCYEIRRTMEEAFTNFFIKYGEMPHWHRVEDAFMKQKHRLIWQRRHGEVGTGMKTEPPVE